MENNEVSKGISIADLLEVLRKSWIFMIAAALIVGVVAFLYANVTYVEEYTAVSKYVVLTNENESGDYNSGNYSMDLKAVVDVQNLLMSEQTVITRVIEECRNLGYDNENALTYKSITGRIVIETDPETTRFVILKIKDSSPENAKILSEAFRRVIKPAALEKLQVEVNYTDIGVNADKPSNGKYTTLVKLIPIVAAAAVYVLAFVIYFYDDKIKTEEHVSEGLALNLLGVIPNIEDSGKIKSRYYQYYYRRKYYRYGNPPTETQGEATDGSTENK